MHLIYRISLRVEPTKDVSHKSGDLNNQAWEERQSPKSATKLGTVRGISNERPSVDPNALLERINKSLTARGR